jgi:DNA-binding MarR family transcriptional regulator
MSHIVRKIDYAETGLYSAVMTENGYDNWFDEVAIPALLRAARSTYGKAIRESLQAAGFDDIPRNGSFVVAGIARTGAPLADVVKGLGSSKQAVGQLVDTLVARGYLERAIDPDDRRRLTVTLTDRGLAAAQSIRAGVDAVDAALLADVGAEHIAHTKATLASLITAGDHDHDDHE